MALTQLPPLGLYIHTPWCVQKCPYCDFNSHQVRNEIPEEEYIQRLLFDLEREMPNIWGRQLSSIFIGGGTPSLLSPRSFDTLLSGVRALLPFYADMEVTMEANPGTVEAEKFVGFRQAGINRISVGVQSFDDQFLHSLGRIHDGDEAQNAFQIARDAGFDNINLDLMYALPNQSVKEAMKDLSLAIELQPEHLSWYQLTLEPNTLFYAQPPQLPNDELLCDISEQGLALLQNSDYQRYEVSAFARAGQKPSQHNLNYWQFGDYLGIGAGAHGKVSRMDNQTITRKSKRRGPRDYLNPEITIVDNERAIPAQELPLEFMMNAMRLQDGVKASTFFETTGLLLSQIETALRKGESLELLDRSNDRIKPTEKGFNFVNELLEYFMPENFPELKDQPQIRITQIE